MRTGQHTLTLEFPLGKDGQNAPVSSSVEMNIYAKDGNILFEAEQTRRDIVDPIGGYGTDTFSLFIKMKKEEALHLARLLREVAEGLE